MKFQKLPVWKRTSEYEYKEPKWKDFNLYGLCKEIKRLGGNVLDVNAKCARCTFKNNKFPFTVDSEGYIEGYYFNNDTKAPKYRVEKDEEDEEIQWNIIQDKEDDDFQPLVEQVLDSNQSINIGGRAGTGKSTFIKMLHAEMEKRNIKTLSIEKDTENDKRTYKYVSTAPTNKACRIIKGKTIHKFIASFNITHFKKLKYEYIFIDEISMVQELLYNFLSIYNEHFQILSLIA